MKFSVVILAAGEGKRMHSDLPKVLHVIAGKPLIQYVVDVAKTLHSDKIFIVHGHQGEIVKSKLSESSVEWVEQEEQKGTGHAVLQVLPKLDDDTNVLILFGDVPLISEETLTNLIKSTPKEGIGWLTAKVEKPFGLGRIIRDAEGRVVAIVEEKDATEEQKAIHEINTGICLIPAKYLKAWLPQIKNTNAQGEYYLTDLLETAQKHGVAMSTESCLSELEVIGVNDKRQLAYLERVVQEQYALECMKKGLTLLDPKRFDVRGSFTFGKEVVVDVNVVIEGKVTIGDYCKIGSNVVLRNVDIGKGVEIEANSIIEESVIKAECKVGPFARIRPGTHLHVGSKVGNFVEIKKSEIGRGSKINHLSYIGDTKMGQEVNVGAGTITCNYDGVNKYQTIIEDYVFVGSNTQLIAPVRIGTRATIGAGSTITKDVPNGKLALGRAKQIIQENWRRPVKKKKE